MHIDWITVVAQIANFLLLVWLLQRFLYQPITRAMAGREAEIANRLHRADDARQTAEQQASTLLASQDALEAERHQILEQARQDAQALKIRLETDLRQEMEARRSHWRDHLDEERDSLANTLQRRAGHQVLAITREVLGSFARSDLADEVALSFVARLNNLEGDIHQRLVTAAQHASVAASIESSVAFNSKIRRQVTRAVHVALETDIEIEYSQNDDLVLGVRLTIAEQTLEWSAAGHLKRLGTVLDEVIDSTSLVRSGARSSDTQAQDR